MKLKILITLIIIIALCACGKKGETPFTPPAPPAPSYPNIVSFTANPDTINRGTNSTLSWEVTNSTSVKIDQGIGTVSPSGSREVKPLENTTYTLTATNADGERTRSCSITVKDGADVVMISGPIFGPWGSSGNYFCYFGKVKNQGTYEASFVKVYIYLNDSNGNLVAYDYTYVDKTDLDPGDESPWEVVFSDSDNAIRNKIDKSKTEYEIEWSEYTWVVRTGRRLIGM